MGVNLSGLIPSEQIDLEVLKGKTIAIDSFNTLYQFLSTIRDRFTGEPLRDSHGRITSHLSGLFYRTIKLLETGITPVYVFDGEPPEFKRKTVEERIKVRKAAEVKWKEALKRGDTEAVRTYSQGASRLTDEMIKQSQELLESMGVSWIQAPSEGEAEAVYLIENKLAWAAGSQDWDSILFGAERLVRNITITGRRKVPRKEKYIEIKPELVELQKVLDTLGISRDQLITLGILIGTDYNPGGVKGIGPKTALKLVKEKPMEATFKEIPWKFDVSSEKIFDFFKNPPTEKVKIKKHQLNPEKIREIMVKEHEFSDKRISKSIERLSALEDSKKQTGLDRFFG